MDQGFEGGDAAARWHVHQRRKGTAQEPYINHLLEVAKQSALIPLLGTATHDLSLSGQMAEEPRLHRHCQPRFFFAPAERPLTDCN
jgi:hypothetical protein